MFLQQMFYFLHTFLHQIFAFLSQIYAFLQQFFLFLYNFDVKKKHNIDVKKLNKKNILKRSQINKFLLGLGNFNPFQNIIQISFLSYSFRAGNINIYIVIGARK